MHKHEKKYYRPITHHKNIGLSNSEKLRERHSKQIYGRPIEINYPKCIKSYSVDHQFFVINDYPNGIFSKYGAISAFVFLAAVHLIPLLCYNKEIKFTTGKLGTLHIMQPNFMGTITQFAIWGMTNFNSNDPNFDPNDEKEKDNYLIGWHDDLAFITWFMDKNRPLPPGNAFDPYRDIDFKRRKADKFNKAPLYPSWIPTLEATPEQQKEHDKHWKKSANVFSRF